jgi:hypothetical protein
MRMTSLNLIWDIAAYQVDPLPAWLAEIGYGQQQANDSYEFSNEKD